MFFKGNRINFKKLSVEQSIELTLNRTKHEALHIEDVDTLLRLGLLTYSLYGDATGLFLQGLVSLYNRLILETDPHFRQELYEAFTLQIEAGLLSPGILFLFMGTETNQGIVATATLDFVMLCEPEPDDELSEARTVGQIARNANCPGGIVGGLLLLGDRRLNEIALEAYRALNLDGVAQMAKCASVYANDFQIRFILDRIAELVGPDDQTPELGLLASGLSNIFDRISLGTVLDMRREFGKAGDDDCTKHLKEWPLEEYAQLVVDRLEELAERESDPKVLPLVANVWRGACV